MIRGILYGINNVFSLFYILIIAKIFLSWIPSIRWNEQPWRFVSQSTDWYLDLFRRIIPPIRMLDISPIVAILVLQIVQNIVNFILMPFAR